MVPIPEGVETSEEEPSDDDFRGLRGNGNDLPEGSEEGDKVHTTLILGGKEGDDELRG